MFGDPSGRLSPVTAVWLLIESKSRKPLKKPPIRGLYYGNKDCTPEDVLQYLTEWKAWLRPFSVGKQPCQRDPPMKCCNFFGAIAYKHRRMAILAIKYAIMSYVQEHSELARHLGLDPSMEYDIHMPNLLPMCSEPGTEEMWYCPAKILKLMWSSEGICLAYNSPPTSAIYKVPCKDTI